MSITRTSLVSVTARWVPAGTDEQGDFDPYWDGVVDVEQEGPKGPCGRCGDDKEPEETPEPQDTLSLNLIKPVHKGQRLCDSCAAQEEIDQTGLEDLIVPSDFKGPEVPALVTFKGRLCWDCARDYWTGYNECDVEFELEGEPIISPDKGD